MIEFLEEFFKPNNPSFWVFIFLVFGLIIFFTTRIFATYAKFVYPNAKFEAMGNPFINEKKLNDLISLKNLENFIENINSDKDLKISGEKISELQNSLDENFLKIVNMMRKDSSKKMDRFYDSYLLKYDYYLIKKFIKDKLREKELDENILKRCFLEKTKKILIQIINKDKSELINILEKNDFDADVINNIKEEKIDYLLLDICLDKQLIKEIKKTKVPYKCEKAKEKMLRTLIDVLNIKNILRAKQRNYTKDYCKNLFLGEGQEIAKWLFNEMAEQDSVEQLVTRLEGTNYFDYIKDRIEEYNKSGTVQVFENAVDLAFLNIIKDISTEYYVTIGPSIRFIISKEYEIRNLKVISKGISERVDSEIIKRNLIFEVPR